MYAIYRELHPPTGVEHCLECHFFDLKTTSLVVASASQIRVYNLSKPTTTQKDSTSPIKKKLVQVGGYHLYGNVASLGCVHLSNAERDSILLGFSQAKLSVVEYDPENNDLKTVSLHYFEDEDIKGGLLNSYHTPYLRVDPEDRCAAMLVYGTHLAVLPFKQESLLEGEAMDATTPLLPNNDDHHTIFPSYTIELRSLSETIINVRDFHFLHGYNNPTLFMLYEPAPTWAGRITLRKDSYCIAAISLNMSQRVNPVIWQNSLLPFDICYSIPVPMPIGGVVLVGASSLLYMNQSSQSLGLSLNSFTDSTTNFQLRPLPHPPFTMDCSHAVFVSPDQLMVVLKGGEIYVLTLVPDGLRGLQNILFEKAAASVLPSCICCFGAGHVFLGSRLGNSLLLGYTKVQSLEGQGSEASEQTSAKKIKMDESLGDDPDELEVYGGDGGDASHPSGPTLSSFSFEVLDTVLNIGPISELSIAQPAFLSDEFVNHFELDLELITCSGRGKNGALCVLQREVRPQVVTTFELPGCSDMWTVVSHTEEVSGEVSGYHDYLILSQLDSTMVLQTGQEITELDASGFATQCPTIFAGNMRGGAGGGACYIIQVTSTDVRLLKGTNQLCRVALDMGGGVKSCDITDPYVVILLVDGTVAMLHLQNEALQLTWPEVAKRSKVKLISAYTDTSGLFVTEIHEEGVASGSGPKQEGERRASFDEDELLYGNVDELVGKMSQENHGNAASPREAMEEETTPTSLSNWCATYREDGSLEIYRLPEFKVVFCVRNFSSSPRTLKDSGPLTSDHLHSSESCVGEVLLVGLGPDSSLPHLTALVDEDLVIYSAFPYKQQTTPGHLHLRFSKVQHKVLISDQKDVKTLHQLDLGGGAPGEVPGGGGVKKDVSDVPGGVPEELPGGGDVKLDGGVPEETSGGGGDVKFVSQLREFRDINGYSGVFVCGPYPHWLMVTKRGCIHLHPMFIDGPITSFTSFHNVNCPKGFLYFSAEGELRISLLPSHLSYDAPWPTKKVPTHSTPHYVSYHMESKTLAVVTSEQVLAKEVPVGDDPDDIEVIERDERFIFSKEDKFYLQLYSPLAWEPVPNTKYPLGRFEHVVSMKVMKLRSQETITGRKEFIVVGTTSVCGEDIQCKGKIRIFDVIEVIPEPGKPLTKNKLKSLYAEEQKGPISCLEAVDGLLLACMAQKIYMWHFKDNKDLVGVAFIDTEIYIHKALSLKNFILIADINRSIQLLRYQENLRTLSLVSKDHFPGEVYACDYVVDGQQLGFLASDSDQNLILYQYQPELPESQGGLSLTRRGDFNAGSHINAFFRVHCKSSAPLGAASDVKALMAEKRHVTYFSTLDGGIGYILPVAEKVYRRLLMLQTKLSIGLPHIAGLNPKSFRMFHTRHQYLYTPQRNILDGEVLTRYPQLSLKQKTDFAKQIGTSPSQIMSDLKELDKITAHF